MNKRISPIEEDRKVNVNLSIKLSLRKALKLQATKDDKGMQEALDELIQGYVNGKFKLK